MLDAPELLVARFVGLYGLTATDCGRSVLRKSHVIVAEQADSKAAL